MNCLICKQNCSITTINPLVDKYECTNCHTFYVEKGFLGQLEAFETKYGKTKYQLILNEMEKKSKNQIVVFVVDFEQPLVNIKDAIYLELEDLVGLAHIKTFDINSPLTYGS
ncbi:MAG: hypothetical protein WC196_01350 [Bacilli bacterium]|nr:hypothetical protein [Bacilli bacterium]MDD4065674.1 hypothetical protein [Bacilli bacterium]